MGLIEAIRATRCDGFLMLAGWNTQPDAFNGAWLRYAGAEILAHGGQESGALTCRAIGGSRLYDFAVASPVVSALLDPTTLASGPWAPHAGLSLVLRCRPQASLQRTRRPCCTLPQPRAARGRLE